MSKPTKDQDVARALTLLSGAVGGGGHDTEMQEILDRLDPKRHDADPPADGDDAGAGEDGTA